MKGIFSLMNGMICIRSMKSLLIFLMKNKIHLYTISDIIVYWIEEYGNDIRGIETMYVGNVRKINISAGYRIFEIGDEIDVSEEFENDILDSVIKKRHINVIHCKHS
jgi:hypothetical protein